MITAIDTNVIVALWQSDPTFGMPAYRALDAAHELGRLVVCAPVFSELLAFRGRGEGAVELFLSETGIGIDWHFSEAMWRAAGMANQRHAERRRSHGEQSPRRILADFLIGAHALARGNRLLTMDGPFFHNSFPKLTVLEV